MSTQVPSGKDVNDLGIFIPKAVFKRGSTFGRTFRLANSYGTTINPSSISFKLVNPQETTVISGMAPTRVSTGTFNATYIIPIGAPVGTWTLILTAINSIYSQTETYTFIVE